MVPSTARLELSSSYAKALLSYLTEPRDAILLRAKELGETAFGIGISIVELCHMHQECLFGVRPGVCDAAESGEGVCPAVPASVAGGSTGCRPATDDPISAGQFLGQALLAFDLERREIRRSNLTLRRLNNRLDAELRRLSTLVYDDALQMISAARLALAASECAARGGDAQLRVAMQLLEEVEDRLTSGSWNNQLRIVEDLGLNSAITSLARRFSSAGELEVRVEGVVGSLGRDVSIAIYRSVHEALANVERHARATRVMIRLWEGLADVECSVRDDGVGFDLPEALSQAEIRGSGLSILPEILREAGGSLIIDTAPGSGTEVRISISRERRD